MSGGVHGASGHSEYLAYSSPALPGLPPAILPAETVHQYSAILPADEFHKADEPPEEHGEHHSPSFGQQLWDKAKRGWFYILNGPNAQYGGHGGH